MQPKGSMGDTIYSIPKQAEKVFREGIVGNPLIGKDLPTGFQASAAKIKFYGSDFPSIPINWRFAESVSALLAFEGAFINQLLNKKYGLEPQEINIDTDHAQLFIMSTLLWKIDPESPTPITGAVFAGDTAGKKRYDALFRDCDIHGMQSGLYRTQATGIYKCKDGRFFHLHGSLNPDPTLKSIGLPPEMKASTVEEGTAPYINALAAIDSEDMQHIATDVFKQAGTICYSMDEYAASEHGKANSTVGLYEVHAYPYPTQKPCWWPAIRETCAERPLAGLKVVDLTRIIAAPAVTRGLAELGASVMRVTAPHLPDASQLHIDLNWGKWNSFLDLRIVEDCVRLKNLILDADVVVSGYRPGALDKYGFGYDAILEMCRSRERGIIVMRENCYGWHGPWAGRSGWQQISDANCGVSMEYGRAMGNDEPVTPIFPNSDYCTGIAGVCAVLDAILRRGKDGGSYLVDIALNYYSQWLVNSVGVYPQQVWHKLWTENGSLVFRHHQGMTQTIGPVMGTIMKNSATKLFKSSYFEVRPARALKTSVSAVKTVLQFPQGVVKPGFQVGVRGNGVDKPEWPTDLMTEIVT